MATPTAGQPFKQCPRCNAPHTLDTLACGCGHQFRTQFAPADATTAYYPPGTGPAIAGQVPAPTPGQVPAQVYQPGAYPAGPYYQPDPSVTVANNQINNAQVVIINQNVQAVSDGDNGCASVLYVIVVGGFLVFLGAVFPPATLILGIVLWIRAYRQQRAGYEPEHLIGAIALTIYSAFTLYFWLFARNSGG